MFNVRPVKFGNKRLNIVISIIKNGSKKEVVYTDTVFIKMSVKNQVLTFWQKLAVVPHDNNNTSVRLLLEEKEKGKSVNGNIY